MAIVVNVSEISKRFQTLGWEKQVPLADIQDVLVKQNISGTQFLAYLDALIATPNACDDNSIASCPAATATKISTGLKTRGVIFG